MINNLPKQDRQGVKKAKDVERKYDLGNVVQTVRVIQEASVPDNVLQNYYSKDEVDYKTHQLRQDIEEQISSMSSDYREVEGVIEWINPPMALDTEYRTVERWMSKPVYTKLVKQDISLRGSTSVEYETPYQIEVDVVTPDFEQLVRANGYTTGYTNIILPQMSEDGYMLFGSVSTDKIYVNVKNHLFTNDAFLYIQIWYTKSTL